MDHILYCKVGKTLLSDAKYIAGTSQAAKGSLCAHYAGLCFKCNDRYRTVNLTV